MWRSSILSFLAATCRAAFALAVESQAQSPAGPRFEVTLEVSMAPQSDGRLLVVLAPAGSPEPRRLIGRTGTGASPILGRDVRGFTPGQTVTLDGTSALFPLEDLEDLEPGTYAVQAVLLTNRDLRSPTAPGTLYSRPVSVTLGAEAGVVIRLHLDQELPPETLPADDGLLRYVRIRSELLSSFHGRPIYLRAGVILPVSHDDEPDRKYPVRVRTGGYGARYTVIRRLMRPGHPFRTAWMADDAPQMLLLHLDGTGPFGDPYQVNSANNGPYRAAVPQELIPDVEERIRGLGRAGSRVLDGSATGGGGSLALQIFYPDYFGGAWASCPDSVDFRGFQLVNIYADDSAYLDARGDDLASARGRDGEIRFTMRHELRLENVLGEGDRWTMSGRQWGAWNAAYGPRGPEGLPQPLWDPGTGRLDRAVARQWERYDLRRVLEVGWDKLAPQLKGKLNIWVGEMDDYFLEDAVHLLDGWLASRPGLDARIEYGAGRGHCWTGISASEMLQEMSSATAPPAMDGAGVER